ncbi:phosphatase PAP2 family protein [Halomonas sp. YLGW01]|uniref:phosphatase PAP2 family protein n=1 Tax=Halomonas sp. YLGW01 TaxID=2773308 RepID=UPI001781AEA2|nr:phosphatase PAP2 family protein [Halomonas sp. YLGW01]
MTPRTPAVFERLDLLEWKLCHRLASASNTRLLPLATLRLASRLGDWPAWVALILAQPLLDDTLGWQRLVQFSLTAVVALLFYRLVKTRLCRERPSITFACIPCTEPPRDRYSFPSGHTMHAVMFTLLTAASTPWLLVIVAPLAALIAASRVGLGLHYISDVIGGGLIGVMFALASLTLLTPAV